MELSPSWEAANCAAIQQIPSNFKEPESLSPCSKEPSTEKNLYGHVKYIKESLANSAQRQGLELVLPR
jgi:hypothetical protein